MGGVSLQVAREVDDGDGIKRTLLQMVGYRECKVMAHVRSTRGHARIRACAQTRPHFNTDATADAQRLGNGSNLVLGRDLDTQLPCRRRQLAGTHAVQRDRPTPTGLRADSPILLTGHDLRHSWRHFLGLQRSALTMATRVSLSSSFPLERDICILPPPLPEMHWAVL